MATNTPLWKSHHEARSTTLVGRERRRSPRYLLRRGDACKGHYQIIFRRTRTPLSPLTLCDISDGGLSFKTKSPVPLRVGELIGIDFTLPKAGPVALQGTVTRLHRQAGQLSVGVAFHGLPAEYQRLLGEQISKLLAAAERAGEQTRGLLLAHMPRLRQGLLVGKDVLILALFLLSAALLFSYMHTLNQSDAWVDDAYKFFSRVAPR